MIQSHGHGNRLVDALWAVLRGLIIAASVLVAVVPFVYLLLNSVKLPMEFLSEPPTILPTQITFEHYAAIFVDSGGAAWRNLTNSLVIATATTLIAVFFGALAAYSLARLRLPYRLTGVIAFAFLAVRFYPKITTTLPYFTLMRQFGLLDTRTAIIIAHVSITLPFVVWLMMTFFQELPIELEESAMLDGCNPWQRFIRIVVPLAAPGLVTAAIFTAIVSWNEFLIASSLASIHAKTLPVAVTSFVTDKGILWGPMSAMSTVIIAPILLFALFLQRYLVRGLTLGAVKE